MSINESYSYLVTVIAKMGFNRSGLMSKLTGNM